MKKIFTTIIIGYIIVSIPLILFGIIEASSPPLFNTCSDQWSRIEYMFPEFRVGCYLGEVPK